LYTYISLLTQKYKSVGIELNKGKITISSANIRYKKAGNNIGIRA